MPKITVVERFKFAEDGMHVVEYAPGAYEVSDRVAEVALENGWAKARGKKGAKKSDDGGNQDSALDLSSDGQGD